MLSKNNLGDSVRCITIVCKFVVRTLVLFSGGRRTEVLTQYCSGFGIVGWVGPWQPNLRKPQFYADPSRIESSLI